MPSWIAIPDSAVAPNAPITSGLMTALRDNIGAFATGATGAPHMQASLIAPGGSAADGAIDNSSSLSDPGYYDFDAGGISTAKTLAWGTIIRVRGNFTLSAALTVSQLSGVDERTNFLGQKAMDGHGGRSGVGAGGGGGGGDGGNGRYAASSSFGEGGRGLNTMRRWWLGKRPMGGGCGGPADTGARAVGGGFCWLIVDGDFNATGGSITANGAAGPSGSSSWNGGGAGGGSIVIICTGAITGGTFTANGGYGAYGAGGGGGGAVACIATGYASSPTLTASPGGTDTSSLATTGIAGLTEQTTLTAGQINGLVLR